jgi:S-DNA-T family DNA segregation ATPase FtsK/SpoIIIE
VISECHELFGHATHGEQAEKLAISVIKQGRKFGITLILVSTFMKFPRFEGLSLT